MVFKGLQKSIASFTAGCAVCPENPGNPMVAMVNKVANNAVG